MLPPKKLGPFLVLAACLCSVVRAEFCTQYIQFMGHYLTQLPTVQSTAPEAIDQFIQKIILDNQLTAVGKLRDVLAGEVNPYDTKEFLEELEKTTSQGIATILTQFYGPNFVPQFRSQVLQFNPKLERIMPLLLDPGIASKAGEFVTFLLADPNRLNGSLHEIRTAFSQSLRTVTVFRGMALTPDQVTHINAYGITSRGRAVEGYPMMTLFLVTPRVGIARQFQQVSGSPFLSVTANSKFAGAVVNTLFENSLPAGTHNIVFELKLPALSVIDRRRLQISSPDQDHKHCYLVEPGGQPEWAGAFPDPAVESYVYMNIPASAIVGHKEFTGRTYFVKQ